MRYFGDDITNTALLNVVYVNLIKLCIYLFTYNYIHKYKIVKFLYIDRSSKIQKNSSFYTISVKHVKIIWIFRFMVHDNETSNWTRKHLKRLLRSLLQGTTVILCAITDISYTIKLAWGRIWNKIPHMKILCDLLIILFYFWVKLWLSMRHRRSFRNMIELIELS